MRTSTVTESGILALLLFAVSVAKNQSTCLPAKWNVTAEEIYGIRISWTTPASENGEHKLCACYPIAVNETEPNVTCSGAETLYENASCLILNSSSETRDITFNRTAEVGSVCLFSECGESSCKDVNGNAESRPAVSVTDLQLVSANKTSLSVSWRTENTSKSLLVYFRLVWCVKNESCSEEVENVRNCSGEKGDDTVENENHVFSNLTAATSMVIEVFAVDGNDKNARPLGFSSTKCFKTPDPELIPVTIIKNETVGISGIRIDWQAVENTDIPLSGYRVRWCTRSHSKCSKELLDLSGSCGTNYREIEETHLSVSRVPPESVLLAGITAVYKFKNGSEAKAAETTRCFESLAKRPMSVTNLRLESQQDGQLVSWNYSADKDVSVTPKYDIRWCSKDISDCAHEKLDLQECDSESAENGTDDKNVLISNLKPWSTVVVEVSAVYQDETRSDIVKGPAAIKCFEIPVAEPGGVKHFEVTSVKSDKATISWAPPSVLNGRLDGYRLVLCEQEKQENGVSSDPGSCNTPLLVDGNKTQYLLKQLMPWTSYTVKIGAYNTDPTGQELEGPTNILKITTTMAEPGIVHHFNATSIKSRSVTIEWSRPSYLNGPLEGYKLVLCKKEEESLSSVNGSCNTAVFVEKNETTFVLERLTPWTNYTVHIAAYNADVNESKMEGPTATMNFRTAVDSPSRVFGLKLIAESEAIKATWKRPAEPNGPISSYKITLCQGNITNCSVVELEGDVTYHSFQDIQPWQRYKVELLAINEEEGRRLQGPSLIQYATTLPSGPAEPENLLQDHKTSSSALFIKWNPPKETNGPLSGYNVSWTSDGGATLASSETNETEFEILHLRAYTTYTVSVRAFNEWQELKWYGTPAILNLTTEVDAPQAPKIHINGGSRSAAVELLVPSVPNGPLNGSYLTVCRMDVGCSHHVPHTSTCDPEYEVEGRLPLLLEDLLPWTYYEIRARMYNVDSRNVQLNGTYAKQCFRTKPAEPSKPSLLRAANSNKTSLTVAWSAPEQPNGPIHGYNVSWTNEKGTLSADVGQALSYAIPDLQPYTEYDVQVLAFNRRDSRLLIGPPAKLLVRTKPDVPGPVGNLRVCAFPNNTAVLTWLPPEIKRGALEGFVVMYNSSKPDKPTRLNVIANDLRQGDRTQCEGEPVTCTLWLENLPAEYEYVFDVRGKNADIDQLGEATGAKVIVPPGDPPRPKNLSMIMGKLDAPDPQTQHAFAISRKMFDDSNGDIIEYTVVLGSPEGIESAVRTRQAWRTVSMETVVPAHPVTPDHWNPFDKDPRNLEDDPMSCKKFEEDSATLICVLGTQSCSEATLPCNGPLRPGTAYAMYVIGRTRGGEMPTAPEEFRTLFIEPVRGKAGAVVGGIVTALLLMALVFGGAIYILRTKNRKKQASQERTSADTSQLGNSLVHLVHLSTVNGSARKEADVSVEHGTPKDNHRSPVVQDINKPILKCNFEAQMHMMKKDSAYRFSDEYERLVELSPQYPSEAARDPANSKKNRFTNIHPFDKSRVPLSVVGNDEKSSYINASFVQGCNGEREYIAAQGPNLTTINDFWRMIWEHDIQIIIMLTQCVEGNKKKCEKYWPDEGKEHVYGTVQVRNESSQRRKDFILTECLVKSDDSSKWRSVRHVFFTGWRDHGTPETPETLIKFVRTCQGMFGPRRGTEPPILVHCSAGVGRTGTFIALDCCLQKLETQNDIDIFHLVLGLRECRRSMVQNEVQYVYLYECVNAVIQEAAKGASNDEPIYQNLEELNAAPN
uniref:protein-tyrosine-phosphatase n=3 Tax=Ixodes scapularis TaxID=6945 RepID=A0A4D5RJG4_IXOSC